MTSALFGTINFGIFEIYGMFAWTRGDRGRASADILWTRKEEGQFLVILC